LTIGRQRGASIALILVIFVLVLVGLLAMSALNRMSSAVDEKTLTATRVATAANAIEQFAGTTARLPCPADPTVDTGDEVQATASTCSFDQGTLPWRTIGMRRDDAFDAWGRKISYRVYDGNAGSLTQPRGVSMVECDTVEPASGGATAVVASAGGLCRSNVDPYQRNTLPAEFLAGKGLTLTDNGTVHNDVAYVVISHGATGLGGYTASGVQLPLPNGDEKNNTKATGPFTIRAFSDPETKVDVAAHFDDLLAYRTLPDLVRRINLGARDWPESVLASLTFDRATLQAALGHNPASNTGQSSIDFGTATVRAFNSGGNQNISFVSGAGVQDAIGGVSGFDDRLMSGVGGPDEGLQIDFDAPARQFAFTLDDFGYFGTVSGSPILIEQAELRFFTLSGGTATLVNTTVKAGCRLDGGLASFTVDPGMNFQRVEIRPLTTSPFFGTTIPSAFTLAEVRACPASVTCQTGLYAVGNACP
jgi:type II secretory pathway pseudopilin PulG